jgi:hypothetical protein
VTQAKTDEREGDVWGNQEDSCLVAEDSCIVYDSQVSSHARNPNSSDIHKNMQEKGEVQKKPIKEMISKVGLSSKMQEGSCTSLNEITFTKNIHNSLEGIPESLAKTMDCRMGGQ